jgi:hypothetical protein
MRGTAGDEYPAWMEAATGRTAGFFSGRGKITLEEAGGRVGVSVAWLSESETRELTVL